MTSKQLTQEFRLRQWAQVMRDRRESGQTVRAWCRENEINEKTYYYWQNKLRQAVCEEVTRKQLPKAELIPRGWAQVTEGATEDARAPETLIIEIGSSRIQATKNTDTELLAKVCRVIMSLC